jgi:hypothetical protein
MIFLKGLLPFRAELLPLTVFLASSRGHVNRLGRSYVTQGDRKIRDLMTVMINESCREGICYGWIETKVLEKTEIC